jgi:hypothetical protein
VTARAERAALIQLGAAARAGDNLLDAARSVRRPASLRERVASELRASERRGMTAREQLSRELELRRKQVARIVTRPGQRAEK